MKVTIYTINDCQFSKKEKEFLTTNNIAFEEKNLEQNKDFLTEMLNISNNFAGTPVTQIVKDDGQTVVLKGFTQSEMEKELGIGSNVAPPIPPVDVAPVNPSSNPETEQPLTTEPPKESGDLSQQPIVPPMETTGDASVDALVNDLQQAQQSGVMPQDMNTQTMGSPQQPFESIPMQETPIQDMSQAAVQQPQPFSPPPFQEPTIQQPMMNDQQFGQPTPQVQSFQQPPVMPQAPQQPYVQQPPVAPQQGFQPAGMQQPYAQQPPVATQQGFQQPPAVPQQSQGYVPPAPNNNQG